MHTKPDLRVFLKWMIVGSGSVITDVIRLNVAADREPMQCAINSILVTLISTTIAWLAAALIFVSCRWHHPVMPCCLLFLIANRGFRNRPNIKSHCIWTTLFGCFLALILSPIIGTTDFILIDDELLTLSHPFGSTNVALIGSAAMLTIFAILECVEYGCDSKIDANTMAGNDE